MPLPLNRTGRAVAAVAAWVALRRLRSIAQIPLLFAKSGQLTLLGANGSVPDGEPSNARTAMVVGVLWSFDKLVAIGLRAVGLATIPSSLASLFLAYSGLSVVELTAGEATADKAVTLAKPGVEFLGRWMIAVYTVAAVPLPVNMSAFSGLREIGSVTLVHFLGFVFSCTSTTLLALATGNSKTIHAAGQAKLLKPVGEKEDAFEAELHAQKMFLQRAAHRHTCTTIWSSLTAASFALSPWIGDAPATFCTLIASGLHAERLPKKLQRFGLHPLVISATATASAVAFLGWARDVPMKDAFLRFLTRKGPFAGAGDLIFEFMSPMTLALGFRMFESRRVIYANSFSLLVATFWAATASLLGTTAVSRLCGISAPLSLMLSQRTVSSPFGLAGAAVIGANPALTVTSILFSGVYGGAFGPSIATAVGAPGNDAGSVARGAGIGASSHGVGTANLIGQGERATAAVSSVAMVITGVFHCALCSTPAVRTLLYRLANGGVS